MATKIFLNNDWQDYDYDTLYSTLGYTKIKCEVYAKEGDYVWSWYNPVIREYWDDREWKKLWTPIPPKPLDEIPFLVFDNGLGRIVHTTEEDILSYSDIPPHFISDSLMSYSDISATTISDTTMITTLELGVAVQSFFFTNKGNKETENSEKRGSVSGFIYDETGHLIVGEDIDAGYDNAQVLSLTQVDGNMLSPINGDYIYMSSTRRNWYFHPESGTRYVWSLQVERINPTPPELMAYFNTSKTQIGVGRNGYYLLYDSTGELIPYDRSKSYIIISAIRDNVEYPEWTAEELALLSLRSYGEMQDYLYLITGDSIPYQNGIWYITYTEAERPVLTAYFTNQGADNRDTDVGRNASYNLYDENGQQIDGDTSKTYTITGVYKADGTRLETSSSDFIHVSVIGKLMWYSNVLPSTGTWYYAYRLTYTET